MFCEKEFTHFHSWIFFTFFYLVKRVKVREIIVKMSLDDSSASEFESSPLKSLSHVSDSLISQHQQSFHQPNSAFHVPSANSPTLSDNLKTSSPSSRTPLHSNSPNQSSFSQTQPTFLALKLRHQPQEHHSSATTEYATKV